jgi:UDP-N-acetylmuramoyl-tripeptide--D-alanyl-D-alanine ligase
MLRRSIQLLSLLRSTSGRARLNGSLYVRGWSLLRPLVAAYRRGPLRRTRLVTVVGSFGKTTTTQAVAAALGLEPRRRFGSNAWIGLAAAVLQLRPADRHAVLEVALDRPGQMRSYANTLRPDVVVVTSIGSAHLSSLGQLETTRHEKAEMVRALPPSGLAVLNGDDPNVRWMASQTSARVVTCGLGPDNDVRASDVQLDWPHGCRFTLWIDGQPRTARSRLLAGPQLFSILAALAVARAAGLELAGALERLAELPPVPGRLQPVRLPNGSYLLRDEYKSALETIDLALDLLAEIPARRLAVLGDITEPPKPQGPAYRRLGARLAGTVERTIFVGERFADYAAGARRAGAPTASLVSVGRDPLQAAELLRQELRPGDVVLIKGRGNQRLERVALALQGRPVRCGLSLCPLAVNTRCANCRHLERGWGQSALAGAAPAARGGPYPTPDVGS